MQHVENVRWHQEGLFNNERHLIYPFFSQLALFLTWAQRRVTQVLDTYASRSVRRLRAESISGYTHEEIETANRKCLMSENIWGQSESWGSQAKCSGEPMGGNTQSQNFQIAFVVISDTRSVRHLKGAVEQQKNCNSAVALVGSLWECIPQLRLY